MSETTPPPPTRDPQRIARDIDAQLAASEAAAWARVDRALTFRWYEILLLAALFAFGIPVAVTVVYAIPSDNEALYRFMVFWLLGFLLAVIFCLEFLIRRFRALRRFYELEVRRVAALERRVKQLEGQAGPGSAAPPQE